MLHEIWDHYIWQAETRGDAVKGFDLFVETYEAKYPKAAECLQKDRDELLTFHDFPAQHWQSIRTSEPVHPLPNALLANDNATLGKQILDIGRAEGKPMVGPDGRR